VKDASAVLRQDNLFPDKIKAGNTTGGTAGQRPAKSKELAAVSVDLQKSA
jgi:hypothetical protein